MDFLDVLRGRLRAALDQRAAVDAELDALVQGAEAENRDLNEAETTQFGELRVSLTEADGNIEQLQGRIGELEQIRERRAAAEAAGQALNQQMGRPVATPVVQVGAEPRTYNQDAERRGLSFLRDLATRSVDPAAQDRLVRHMAEVRTDLAGAEYRDLTTGGFSAGLVVPQYLTDMLAPLRRAGRPFADICNNHPLPASGMTLNIPRITTGTATAIQATEGATVQETDIDDTLLTVNVRTVAGQQDLSRQVLERGEGIDQIVLADLVRAYNTTLDDQLLNADGTSGTHLGIRSTGSIVAVTYTDASPTAAEAWPKLYDLIQQVQSGVFAGISHFVMHPRRWAWFASQVGTNFPFVQQIATAPQVAGSVDTYEYGGVVGRIAGVPIVIDGNMLTNLGAGTEDVILGVTASELHLWEEPSAPLMIRAEEPGAPSLQVKFVVYGYSAFTAGRYPGAHGTISGTGLAAPTF
jgi:HK97 family phage major capsid protein